MHLSWFHRVLARFTEGEDPSCAPPVSREHPAAGEAAASRTRGQFNAFLVAHDLVYYLPTRAKYE